MNRFIITLMVCLVSALGIAQEPATLPAQPGKTDKFPFVQVDVAKKRVVVACEVIGCTAPLEFLCVMTGTNEHESILRTSAKPSHIHTGLLMIGMQQGEPVRFSVTANKWLPPEGSPVQISVEFQKDGKVVTIPAHQLFRDLKDKKSMPARTWIFVGSKVLNNGMYAADATGYVVSIVNFDFSLIDVPGLVSSSNETLEYEADTDVVPPAGTKVRMILEPAGKEVTPATANPVSTQPVRGDNAGEGLIHPAAP